jgi:hypothetical protein
MPLDAWRPGTLRAVSDRATEVEMKTQKQHGGRREGAGAKRSNKPRCTCGAHTLARAQRLRLKCGRVAA